MKHLASSRARALAGVMMACLVAAGCASTSNPDALAQNDPYESTNRAVFDFDIKLDRYIASPIARFYNGVLPKPARDSVHNVLANLASPVTLANDVLQGEPERASITLGRMVLNSTIGFGGIVDAGAAIKKLPPHTEDFGQTLGVWGVGEGPYLVLPFVGPNPPRDLAGNVVDTFLDPWTYARFHGADTWMAVRLGVSVLDSRASTVDVVEQIQRSSIDFYATTRSLYRQHRQSEIRNGAADLDNLPDL